MSLPKSWPLSIIFSLLCGGLLFLLTYGLPGRQKPGGLPPGGVLGGGFAALTLDESYPDRQIRELLAREGFKTTIGESSQWVFLDDFGSLEQIPLDEYWDRVEPFDPRNDGYAELLRSFFVSRGERRVFIDLGGAPLDLEGRVKAALGDIRYSLSVPASRRSPLAPGLLFVVAAGLTLLLAREISSTLIFLPLWAPLAGLGAEGFALTAVLTGFSRTLREPALDYFVARRHGTARGRALPPAGVWALCGLFPVIAVVLAVFGSYPLLTVPAALILVPLLLCFSLWDESRRELRDGHIRFRPVLITPLARRSGFYLPVMAPFAVAALALLLLSRLFPGVETAGKGVLPRTGWNIPPELNAERYQEHRAFQQAFSYTSLGGEESFYLHYSLAEDGLVLGDGSGEALVVETEGAIPPFPLASLIDFLAAYAYTGSDPAASRGDSPACPLIVLGLCVPLILRDWRWRKSREKLSMHKDKRIAA
jgi:hypothetical protein